MILSNFSDAWGARVYVTWFTLSNFIAPLVALSFYYVKICAKIRRNLRAKKRMLPANANIVNPLIKLSSGSSSTMELSSTLPGNNKSPGGLFHKLHIVIVHTYYDKIVVFTIIVHT